ncbi:MAG: hypothetical protein L6Q59_14580 [Ignavibacteriaceae bacterium]|nr:hypothetical protein [Ignavibacteriaceae bacterium]
MPDYFRLIDETEQIPPEKGEIKMEADGTIVFQTSAGPLKITKADAAKALSAIVSLNGSSPPAITVVKNTTGKTFSVSREDAGIYKIISDSSCFTRGSYVVFAQVQSEIDFQGFTIGFTEGNDTILYLNLLSPTEGYLDAAGDLYLKIEFN